MSEIDIRRKVKNEENVVAFSPAKVSVLSAYGNVVENGKPASVSELEGNNVLSGEYFNSSEHSSDPSEIDEVGDAKENDKERKSHNVRDDNDKFCQDISTATPVMHKDTIIDSRQVSDKTPLLNEMSSVNGSSTDLNTEGDNETSEASCECSYLGDRDSDRSSLNSISITSQRKDNLMMPGSIQVPIVGHEIVESRTRFTVFKIHVKVQGDDSGWFIFRRYSDFVHLNDQLKILYPNFRLSLPPKRWFRSNFDFDFLEERLLGLQAFVHNVTGHSDICNSKPARDFFCFDNPPGPHESLEESRAQCECMEESLFVLKKELTEKSREILLLNEELDLYKNQVQLLTKRLSELNRRSNFERSGSEKHRSSAGVGHFGIDTLLDSGGHLLTNNLDKVSKLGSPERKTNEQISPTDT